MNKNNRENILPDNYWKRIVLTFFLGWAVIWIYRTMLSPIYVEIQETIGPQTNAAMGLIASFYFFGYTFMQIPSGFLADKLGEKNILIPGFIIFALGTLSISRASSLTSIYIGSVLAGMGCGSYYGAAFSLTTRHVPVEKKGVSTAIVNSGSALGLIIGMTGSSYVVKTLNLPWQTMVIISASLIILMTIWFAIGIKNNKASQDNKEEAVENINPIDKSSNPTSLFSLKMFSNYILYFTPCYAYYMIVTWLPEFLETERGISGGMIGLIVSMISVTAVPGGIFFAYLSDKKLKRKSLIIIALEIFGFILVAYSMRAANATILSIVLLAYGFLGKMAVDPVLISFISDNANDKDLATTLGIFNFLVCLPL